MKTIRSIAALLLASALLLALMPAAVFAEESAPAVTAEFHMTDSDWSVNPDTGYASEINRHPSVYVTWETDGLDAPDGGFWYTAGLYVYSGPAYRVKNNLKDLAERNGWAQDDPRRTCIFGLGNNYWSAEIPESAVTESGGCFTGVLEGVYKYDVSNACVQDGDDCCWQLLIYRCDADSSELVLQSEITDATVEYLVGAPYMTAAPADSYAAIYSESGYGWSESLFIAPTETVDYEAEFYVWPGQGLADPYGSEFGWINTLPFSTMPDMNVLAENGMWAQDLYWFDNTGAMEEITVAPGMKVTMGAEIYAIDRSGGGFSYSLFRRLPVVEFALAGGSVVQADQPSISMTAATVDSGSVSDLQITK